MWSVVLAAFAVAAAMVLRARPETPAAVTVYDDGTPYADRWVVFHDPAGNVLSSAKSDAAGKVAARIPDGGMVTVAYGSSIQRLVTVVGVKPGEGLIVGEKEDEGEDGNTLVRARVTLPGRWPEAARYVVSLGVAVSEVPDPTQPITLSVLERLVVKGRFAVLAEAVAPSGEAVAHAFTWAEAGDAGTADVSLPAWSTDVRAFEVELANATGVVHGELGMVTAGSNRFLRPRRPASERGLRFLVPEPLGDEAALRIEAAWSPDDRAGVARRRHLEPKMRVDLGAELFPRVSRPSVVRGADPARPSVTWSVAEARAGADALVVRLKWPATGEHEWTIVLPPATRAPFRLPALPPVLATWRPDARAILAAVGLVDSSEYEGYDEVRAKGIDAAAEGVDEDEDGFLRWSTSGDLPF